MLQIRAGLEQAYPDVYTPEALAAIDALAPLNADRRALMTKRIARRAERARAGHRIEVTKGLTGNEQVIVSGKDLVHEDTPVNVQPLRQS